MLLLVALLSLGAVERDARVSAAIDRYETGAIAKARDALIDLVDAPGLSDADRADVRAYLAACYLAQKDAASARLQLRQLAREQPNAKPSPAVFSPDLLKLADEIWADAEKRAPKPVTVTPPPERPTPAVAERLPTPGPVAVTPPPSRAWAVLPFGIGHFARGDVLQGVVFLALELVSFGTGLVATGLLEGLKAGDRERIPFFKGEYSDENFPSAVQLNRTAGWAFGAWLAVAVVDVVHAFATWPSHGQ